MKKIFFLSVILVALLSCDKHESKGGTDQELTVSIGFSLDELAVFDDGGTPRASSPLTRATPEIDESRIDTLWVLQFSAQVAGGKLLNKTSIITNGTEIENGQLTVRVNLKPEPDGYKDQTADNYKQQLRFVANVAPDLFEDLVLYTGETQDPPAFTLQQYDKRSIDLAEDVLVGRIPMVGVLDTRIREGSEGEPEQTLSAELYRLYAKVEAIFYVEDSFRDDGVYFLKVTNVKLFGCPTKIPLKRLITGEDIAACVNPGTRTSQDSTISDRDGYERAVTFYMPTNIGGVYPEVKVKDGKVNREWIGNAYTGDSGTSVAYIEYHMKLINTTATKDVSPFKNGTTYVYKIFLGVNVRNDYNVLSNSSYRIETAITDIGEKIPNFVVTDPMP